MSARELQDALGGMPEAKSQLTVTSEPHGKILLDEPRMLRPEDVASRWGVDKKTVYAAIRLHQLPFIRLGKRVLLISARVIESIEQGRVPLPGGKHGSGPR